MATATYVSSPKGWDGDAHIYQMEPPHQGFDQVVVSPLDNGLTTETYIFGLAPDGEVNWDELPGSRKGSWAHAQILESIGYQIVTPTDKES